MWHVAQIQGALSNRTKKPEQTHGICLFRDLWVSGLVLGLFISVNQEMSLHPWKMKRSRLETITSACELIQEAQLFNEHYDLNARTDPINLLSVGVHTQLVQIYPSLGSNSIIIRDLALLPKAPWGGAPQEWKGNFPGSSWVQDTKVSIKDLKCWVWIPVSPFYWGSLIFLHLKCPYCFWLP